MLSTFVFVLPRGRATFAVHRLRRIPSNTQKLSQLNLSCSRAGQNLRASSDELVAPFGGDSLGGSLVDSKHGGLQILWNQFLGHCKNLNFLQGPGRGRKR